MSDHPLIHLWHYGAVIFLMMTGLWTVIAKRNFVKKLMGLSIFQVAVIMFYVSMGKIEGGTPPVYLPDGEGGVDLDAVYSNPLPHVLMLTAIVVGVATTALGLALVVRIREAYGSSEENEVLEADRADEELERAEEEAQERLAEEAARGVA
ncbi:MAG: multicomponent Na+:H+ antiporter subunit C [Polyangiales bacterium]|jgi:multicomponent Na+:H+ antiporter subunit C